MTEGKSIESVSFLPGRRQDLGGTAGVSSMMGSKTSGSGRRRSVLRRGATAGIGEGAFGGGTRGGGRGN